MARRVKPINIVRDYAQYALIKLKREIDNLMPEYCELGSAVLALIWAVRLILPNHTFDSSPTFSILKHIAPEWGFGVFCLGLFVVQMKAFIWGSVRFRRWAMFTATVWWALMMLLFWQSNPDGLLWPSLITCVITGAYAYILLGEQEREGVGRAT